MEVLQTLAVGLSKAVSSVEVAHVITDQAMVMLGAQGSALGLVEGEDLVIVDPVGLAARAHVPGGRLALTSLTLMTQSARKGVVVRVDDRATLARSFPDSAHVLPASVRCRRRPSARGGRGGGRHGIPLRGGGARWTTRRWRPCRPSPALPSRLSSARACTSASGSRGGHWIGLAGRAGFPRRDRGGGDGGDLSRGAGDVRCRLRCALAASGLPARSPEQRSSSRRDAPGPAVPLDDLSGLAEAVANHGVSFSRDVLLGARGGWLERVVGWEFAPPCARRS